LSGVDDFKKGRSGGGVLVWLLCRALEGYEVVVGRGCRRSCEVVEGEVRRCEVGCVRGEGGQEEGESGAAEGGGGRVEHRAYPGRQEMCLWQEEEREGGRQEEPFQSMCWWG